MDIDISHITLPDNFHSITDFYVPEDAIEYSILYPGPIETINYPDFTDIIQFIADKAKEKTAKKREFSLELKHEGKRILLRGHYITSTEGKVYIFRRLPSYVPRIEDLGIQSNILELLLHERLNSGGLVIIAGETGQGKSTTAAATIAYRLRTFGSFCLTIEDPVEMPLQGFYENEKDANKKGVCFQTNVEGDEIFDAIKSSLRCYPSVSNSILFLGETRDSIMASEVLKIATNGHLVVTTLHGSDLMTALKRFLSLAISAGNTSESDVKSMFASVFRLMIHQKMEKVLGKKKIKQQILFSPGAASPVASRLRTGSLENLSTEIQNQNMILTKGISLIQSLNQH